MVCDSTNVFRQGESGSEADGARKPDRARSRAAGSASPSPASPPTSRGSRPSPRVAAANNRRAALVGRSLWRMYDAARENGYLTEIAPFLTEEEAGFLPREEVLLAVTGSQGEPRAALARIAAGDHPHVVLERGRHRRLLVAHHSGQRARHRAPAQRARPSRRRGDLRARRVRPRLRPSGARRAGRACTSWIRPRIAVPVHGEPRHMLEHAKLADRMPGAGDRRGAQRRRRAPGAGQGRDRRRRAERPACRRRHHSHPARRAVGPDAPAAHVQRLGGGDAWCSTRQAKCWRRRR